MSMKDLKDSGRWSSHLRMLQMCSCCLGIKPNEINPNPPPAGTIAVLAEERARAHEEQARGFFKTTGLLASSFVALRARPAASKKKTAVKLCGGLCALLAIVALITAAVAAGRNMAPPQPHNDTQEQPTGSPAAVKDNSSGTPATDQPQPHCNLADPLQPQSSAQRACEAPGDGGGKVQALPWLIQFANAEGKVSQVEAWLDGGGDVDARDQGGSTLLMGAAFYGSEPTVQMLLERGAAVNVQSPAGLTALMGATLNRHTVIVRRLLKAGAATGLRSGHGETALQIARRKRFADCAQLLQSHGPPSGDRPLSVASRRRR